MLSSSNVLSKALFSTYKCPKGRKSWNPWSIKLEEKYVCRINHFQVVWMSLQNNNFFFSKAKLRKILSFQSAVLLRKCIYKSFLTYAFAYYEVARKQSWIINYKTNWFLFQSCKYHTYILLNIDIWSLESTKYTLLQFSSQNNNKRTESKRPYA